MEQNKNIMSPKRSSRRVNALKNISYVLNNSDDENSPIKNPRIHNLEKENQNEELSDYEKIRLQNIAERDKMFKQFKLKDLASNLNKTLPKLTKTCASKPLWSTNDDPEYMPQVSNSGKQKQSKNKVKKSSSKKLPSFKTLCSTNDKSETMPQVSNSRKQKPQLNKNLLHKKQSRNPGRKASSKKLFGFKALCNTNPVSNSEKFNQNLLHKNQSKNSVRKISSTSRFQDYKTKKEFTEQIESNFVDENVNTDKNINIDNEILSKNCTKCDYNESASAKCFTCNKYVCMSCMLYNCKNHKFNNPK